jgi:hypothetical protein
MSAASVGLVAAVAAVAVDVSASAAAERVPFSYGAGYRGSGVTRDFSFKHLVRPRQLSAQASAQESCLR